MPGDIVLITTGDRVPADLRLIDSHDLTIDESNLTGETEAAVKSCVTRRPTIPPLGDDNNNNESTNLKESRYDNVYNKQNGNNYSYQNDIVGSKSITSDRGLYSQENIAFMGTLVQSGHGKGIVIGTGESTQFGQVFKMMQSEETPKSPLQRSMDQLGAHLSVYSLGVIVVIVIVGWLQSRPVAEMFAIGVSLAVAAIPEGLPIVVTVTLALGVMRMAKRKAVVKQLSAVETLGCVNVICSDKTGTLTRNEMTVTKIATSEFYLADVTGVGYEEPGDVILCDLNLDQSKQMLSIKRLLYAACLCNNATFDSSNKLMGQPTEGAILVAMRKLGLSDPRDEHRRIEEIPFNSNNKFMAVRCIPNQDSEGASDCPMFYLKGATEIIVKKCSKILKDGSYESLTDSMQQDVLRGAEKIESQGLRVLAIAHGPELDNLTFLGVIGIHDAPKPGIMEAIETLREGGVRIKMVTGDSRVTAESIARQLSILRSSCASMSGQEIDELLADRSISQLDVAERLDKVAVFYRVTPAHKLTIVKMLQSLGYITAMTGDGVNDSVALKKADIGIAMGAAGTDVCKEAASVVLMDDNLATIVVALEEGKGIFYNIRNFVRFQLSTSIAALSLIAVSTVTHIANPLNAMQILYINILMDGPPAQSLGVEKVSQDVLMLPPRNVKEPVLNRDLIINVLISASVIFSGTFLVFVSEVSST